MRSTVRHWDSLWAQDVDEEVHVRELERIIALNKARGISLRGRWALECGAGSGVDSIALAQRTGCKCCCVDYSPEALRVLRRNFRVARLRARLVKADICKMPLRSSSFDVVFSNGVLEHFRQPVPVLREQARVLRPGGLLVVGVPGTYSLYTVKKHLQMRLGTWFAGWETEYTKRELVRLAEKAGLRVLDARTYGNAPRTFPHRLQRVTTVLGLNRWLAHDVIVYCTK